MFFRFAKACRGFHAWPTSLFPCTFVNFLLSVFAFYMLRHNCLIIRSFCLFFGSYYGLTDCNPSSVSTYLSQVVSGACNQLIASQCIQFATDRVDGLECTEMGRLASFYYLSHKTILLFIERLRSNATVHDLLAILAVSCTCSDHKSHTLLCIRHS